MFVSVQSAPFSGSTLLAFLLGSHPQIATVGEMDGLIPGENPDQFLCSCGRAIRCCEFWRSVKATMQEKGHAFDVSHFDTKLRLQGSGPLKYLRYGSTRHHTLDGLRDAMLYAMPGERRAALALVARNAALVDSVLEVTGKKVFVDTSKGRHKLEPLRRFSGLDIRIIHLVRDARGVVASMLRHGRSLDAGEAARNWRKWHEKLRCSMGSFPQSCVTTLRYEDLCSDADLAMDRVCRFCGVDPDARVTDYRAAPHHIIGNSMRLRDKSEIVLDERWRRELDPDQLREIRRVTGAGRRRHGYY